MKKLICVMLLCALGACGRWPVDYNPQTIQPVKNQAKFENDRSLCIEEAQIRFDKALHSGGATMSAAFGAIGYAISSAAAKPEDDYNKNRYEMANECMIAKGYKLASR